MAKHRRGRGIAVLLPFVATALAVSLMFGPTADADPPHPLPYPNTPQAGLDAFGVLRDSNYPAARRLGQVLLGERPEGRLFMTRAWAGANAPLQRMQMEWHADLGALDVARGGSSSTAGFYDPSTRGVNLPLRGLESPVELAGVTLHEVGHARYWGEAGAHLREYRFYKSMPSSARPSDASSLVAFVDKEVGLGRSQFQAVVNYLRNRVGYSEDAIWGEGERRYASMFPEQVTDGPRTAPGAAAGQMPRLRGTAPGRLNLTSVRRVGGALLRYRPSLGGVLAGASFALHAEENGILPTAIGAGVGAISWELGTRATVFALSRSAGLVGRVVAGRAGGAAASAAVGRFASRWIPIIGQVLLIYDISVTSVSMITGYDDWRWVDVWNYYTGQLDMPTSLAGPPPAADQNLYYD